MLFRIARLALLACLLHILTIHTGFANGEEQKAENALKLIKHLSETRKGLTALKQIVNDIDGDLQNTQKIWKRIDPCLIGGGNHGYACHLKNIAKQNKGGWLYSSMLSPGKRSESDPDRTLDDLSRKRKGLEILSKFIDEMEADLVNEQKRTCNFNLGGHCATESAAYVADHWHYLNSALSPGRKRRDTGFYKKLVSGKLLP